MGCTVQDDRQTKNSLNHCFSLGGFRNEYFDKKKNIEFDNQSTKLSLHYAFWYEGYYWMDYSCHSFVCYFYTQTTTNVGINYIDTTYIIMYTFSLYTRNERKCYSRMCGITGFGPNKHLGK